METFQSEQINELVAAIVAAQVKMVPASKDHVNPYFKSKYADLPTCWEAVSSFREAGIAITQSPMDGPDGYVLLDTQLSHTSGQWMRSRLKIRVAKDDPQGYGSAITYARRYALGCMTGLVTEEDDDGNAASTPQQQKAHAFQQQKQTAQAKMAEFRQEYKPEPQAAGTDDSTRQHVSPQASDRAPAPTRLPNYGRAHCKGKLVNDPDVTVEDLRFYLNGAIRNLENPDKAKYHATEQRVREAIEHELARREETQYGDEQAEWNKIFTAVEADPDLAELKETVKADMGIDTLLFGKTTPEMRAAFVVAFRNAAEANNLTGKLAAVGL